MKNLSEELKKKLEKIIENGKRLKKYKRRN
jgi:hypothetical protein